MGKVVIRSQKERDLAIKIVKDGGSFEDASTATGYKVDYVRQLCTKAGVHTPRSKKDPEREQKAIELLSTGWYANDVAKELGYTKSGVLQIIRRYSIPYESEKKKELEDRDKKVFDLRTSGKSIKEISEELNIPYNYAESSCRRLGLGGAIAKPVSLGERKCKRCGKLFMVDSFHKNQKYCSADCTKSDSHSRNDIIRKRLKNKLTVDQITLHELAKRDNNICYLCGKRVNWQDYRVVNGVKHTLGDYPSIDHVIPLAKGGLHSWENVKLAHIRCNASKGVKL